VFTGEKFRLYLYLVRDERVGKYFEIVPDTPPNRNLRDVYKVRLLKDALNIIKQFDRCEEVIE